MIVNYWKGDLVKMLDNSIKRGDFFSMAQGCNCFVTQGSGIAGQLRRFPEVYKADVRKGMNGCREKLGDYSVAEIANSTIYNLYTQHEYANRSVRNADYAAIAVAFCELNKLPIGTLFIPRIGAGLAGGNWDVIEQIINDATPDLKIIVVDFEEGYDPRYDGGNLNEFTN